MRDFVDEDTCELGARAIEGDPPLAQKGAGVNGAGAVAQSADAMNPDGLSPQRGQSRDQGTHAGLQARIVAQKKTGGVHPR